MGFAELRKAAGIRDSGNFNYHLDRLLDRFVEKADAGYTLNPAGMQLVAAIVSGSYEGALDVERTPVGQDCPLCGTPLAAFAEGGQLHVGCENDHALSYPVPPHVVDEGIDAAVELLVRRAHAELALVFADRCPMCAGHLERSVLVPGGEGVSAGFRFLCQRCGIAMTATAAQVLLHEPRVARFFEDHGVDVRSDPAAMLALASEEVVAEVGEDPTRFVVELERDGERLRGVVDSDARVREVERR